MAGRAQNQTKKRISVVRRGLEIALAEMYYIWVVFEFKYFQQAFRCDWAKQMLLHCQERYHELIGLFSSIHLSWLMGLFSYFQWFSKKFDNNEKLECTVDDCFKKLDGVFFSIS